MISPKVQSGERSHPASMMSGVRNMLSNFIAKFDISVSTFIVSLVTLFVSDGVVAVTTPLVVSVASAATIFIPSLICTPPLLLTLSSPLVIKSPAQRTDRRASREILERAMESDISLTFMN